LLHFSVFRFLVKSSEAGDTDPMIEELPDHKEIVGELRFQAWRISLFVRS
jgi:hypothetical protein